MSKEQHGISGILFHQLNDAGVDKLQLSGQMSFGVPFCLPLCHPCQSAILSGIPRFPQHYLIYGLSGTNFVPPKMHDRSCCIPWGRSCCISEGPDSHAAHFQGGQIKPVRLSDLEAPLHAITQLMLYPGELEQTCRNMLTKCPEQYYSGPTPFRISEWWESMLHVE